MSDSTNALYPVPLGTTGFGLSLVRFAEQFAFGQINPFGISPAGIRDLSQTFQVIDVVVLHDTGNWSLTGLTLADLTDSERLPAHFSDTTAKECLRLTGESAGAARMVRVCEGLANESIRRKGARVLTAEFLPPPDKSDQFGVKGLRSRLLDALQGMSRQKLPAADWLGYVNNLSSRGVTRNELVHSGLVDWLHEASASGAVLSGESIITAADFRKLQLSVIPYSKAASVQVRFQPPTKRALPKAKQRVRAQHGQIRRLQLFDPVLGFRIDEVRHPTLWGEDAAWQLIAYDGQVLSNPVDKTLLFDSVDAAVESAQQYALSTLPKLLASQKWQRWAWTGGRDYREWLVTLPLHDHSFWGAHYPVRNVLVHIRCDIREGEQGERVLVIHEIQSDWMAKHRTALRGGGPVEEVEPYSEALTLEPDPPFEKDWPGLALRLMILHAVSIKVDAVAWTTAAQQVRRFGKKHESGFRELYDQVLVKEANRSLKPFGIRVGTVDVYVPENFSIDPVEDEYVVRSRDGDVYGTASTFELALAMIPDGGRESLRDMHGVRLNAESRKAIADHGFYSW